MSIAERPHSQSGALCFFLIILTLITMMRKRFHIISALAIMASAFVMASCGGSDNSEEQPQTKIIVRSCSLSEGTEYVASELKEVTVSYNTVVSVSPSANITLNDTKCSAKSSSTTAMDVIISLPALEEGKAYTLKIPEGAIVYKEDNTVSAPAYQVNFTTKEASKPIINDAIALTKKLGWGWNLGNHFDTSSGEDGKPNQWGYWDNAKPTQTLYENLKKAGVSTVRICSTWGNYQDQDWTIKADFMAEVKQNVDWAGAAGLNVILNLHHDEYWLKIKEAASNNIVNDAIKERIEKTWTQIAEAFKDEGDFLLFESFNEVQDGSWGWGDNLKDGGKQYRTLNDWNQTAVNAIRATGGKNATRWIGVPAYASSPKFALEDSFVLPEDAAGRVMVSVHFYDPDAFTLTPEKENYGKTEWGHTAAAGKYVSGANEAHVVETFQKLQEKYIANNIPVYIGEYGCVMQTTERSNLFRNYYLEYVCRAAYTYNLPLCIWDNNETGGGNEHHGYFDHSDGSYLNGLEQLVQTMIKAATKDDTGYTLESIYESAP